MRKLLLILSVVSFAALSCTDKAYDLSKLDDEIAIGDNASEFFAPLPTISIRAEQFTNNSKETIIDVYDEADIWLPTTIPGGVNYIEVERLKSDTQYHTSIVKALISEMEQSEAKADAVFRIIVEKYKDEYLLLVKPHISAAEYAALLQVTDEQLVTLLKTLFKANYDYVVEAVESISENRLYDLDFDEVTYDIPAFDIAEDIKSMIMSNVGSKGHGDTINRLYIAGTIDSGFPFDFKITAEIAGTDIKFNNIPLHYGSDAEIPEIRIYAEDIEKLFSGSQAIIGFSIDRYYPGKVDINKQEAHFEFHLRKTGNLTI